MTLHVTALGEENLFKMFVPESSDEIKIDVNYVSDSDNKSDEEIIEACQNSEVIIMSPMGRLNGYIIDNLPSLKLIQTNGVGFQWVDIETAAKHNIYVCNCRGVNAVAVAEHTVMLMLALLRDLINDNDDVHQGKQDEHKMTVLRQMSLKELGDCTIGLLGFGAIGKRVAQIASACDAKIIYNDVFRASIEEEEMLRARFVSKEELIAQSDIISIHVPLMDETYKMVNKDFLASMKDESYLVNTARGEIVDSEALLEALKSGHLAGAGLDCIAGEPVQIDNDILKADSETDRKLILSSHIAGCTASTLVRGAVICKNNTLAISKGERPDCIVNQV